MDTTEEQKKDQKPKKVWYKKWWVWAIIIFIILITVSPSSKDNKSKNQTQNTNVSANNLNVAVNENVNSAPVAENPSKPKEWQKVFNFTATANKQSETFHLEGGQQKLIYKTTGGQYTICSIYVMDEGTSLDEGGGFPVVMINENKSDETMMRKKAGDYYFDLMVANGTCAVELQELK